MTKRVPITVWLTPTELATIDRIAAQLERPRSETARRLFNDALSYGAAYHRRSTDLEREADQQAAAARAAMAAEETGWRPSAPAEQVDVDERLRADGGPDPARG